MRGWPISRCSWPPCSRRSRSGLGDSGLDHHPGAERAGSRRRPAAAWVLAAAIAGAVLGDGSAFWVGHRSQREILRPGRCRSYPRVVAQSEAFFHRWGTLAVFFARFVPPIRAFVPITAGALGMPPSRFYAVNIPAILLWAPAHVLPGVLAVSAAGTVRRTRRTRRRAKHYWMPLVVGGAWSSRWRSGPSAAAMAAARSSPEWASMGVEDRHDCVTHIGGEGFWARAFGAPLE